MGRWRVPAAAVSGVLVGMLLAGPRSVRATWEQLTQILSLRGDPVPASANVLSEHHLELLDRQPPQDQATFLLERAMNHYRGATDQIAARVGGWRGQLTLDESLNRLFATAINSDDLRVRAAALDINIVARGHEKTTEAMDRLEPIAFSGEQGPRANALWDMALIGNRGVDPDRALRVLLASVDDSNVNIRYWAVEGLAYLGTDAVITPLLEVFRNDPSPMIRERAACGLSQSGMLSEGQRRTAVPRLLEFAEDWSLDPDTRKWVFQALRDITGQTLPHDASAWRTWYGTNNGQWKPVTRDGNP